MEQKKELFKERAKGGDRMYFFDVKESVKGTKYLVINESKKVGDKFEHNRIFIFEDHIDEFSSSLSKVHEFLKPKEAIAT